MGMGTGENALNPDFNAIIQYLHQRGIKLSIASNGYSLTAIPQEILTAFHDVEVSIDFPSQAAQDEFRGTGNWSVVHQAIERAQNAGIEVSILTTLMSPNYDLMPDMVRLARSRGVNLRVNVYQAVKSDHFRLSYSQFWQAYRELFSSSLVVSCSEPVVKARMGLGPAHSPCGRSSIRINPRGEVIPCVYWTYQPGEAVTLEDLGQMGQAVVNSDFFLKAQQSPVEAAECPCGGGCASRRALRGNMNAHDEYCPWVRGDDFTLDWHSAPEKNLMRSGNVCTTVVI
jgi:radical SAM protein with 4Fe4S-binding SPASM domain